ARQIADSRHQAEALRSVPDPAPRIDAASFASRERTWMERAEATEKTIDGHRKEISSLQAQLEDVQSEMRTVKASLDSRTFERDRAINERDGISLKLIATNNDLLKAREELSAILQHGRSEDAHRIATLQARSLDLQHIIDQKGREFDETRSLLNNDRDIRD